MAPADLAIGDVFVITSENRPYRVADVRKGKGVCSGRGIHVLARTKGDRGKWSDEPSQLCISPCTPIRLAF